MTVPLFPTNLRCGPQLPIQRHMLSKTLIEEAYSGATTANPAWSIPRYQFELGFEFLGSAEMGTDWVTLEGFLRQVKFSAGCLFQFSFSDDSSVADQIFGTGDGSARSFQLLRTTGGFTEPVLAVASLTNVKANGVVVSPSFYSVDARGILTFTAGHAPANGATLTWTGSYNWYCRFDDDDAAFSKVARGFWTLGKITFTTVKTP